MFPAFLVTDYCLAGFCWLRSFILPLCFSLVMADSGLCLRFCSLCSGFRWDAGSELYASRPLTISSPLNTGSNPLIRSLTVMAAGSSCAIDTTSTCLASASKCSRLPMSFPRARSRRLGRTTNALTSFLGVCPPQYEPSTSSLSNSEFLYPEIQLQAFNSLFNFEPSTPTFFFKYELYIFFWYALRLHR